MRKTFAQRFKDFFHFEPALPVVTEDSPLADIVQQLPNLFEFLRYRYQVNLNASDQRRTLKDICREFTLPPPQIVFMEAQMEIRTAGVRHLTAKEAKHLLDDKLDAVLVDAREGWEIKICQIENSRPFTDELMKEVSKKTPVLIYCHFGVRSLNAAAIMKDAGFEEIYVLQGGIEAWSVEIDPNLPRYEAGYC